MADHATQDDNQFYTVNPGDSDPRTGDTLLIGLVGIVLAGVIILGLEVVYHKTANAEFERKIVNAVPQEFVTGKADQLQQINGYHWVDESAGKVAIPIEQAMKLMVEKDVERRTTP